MLKKIVLCITAIACAAMVSPQLTMAEGSWLIHRAHSVINVTEKGEVKVTETIRVNMQDSRKTGITRQIPIKYSVDKNIWFIKVFDISVKRNLVSEPFTVQSDAERLSIIIGDPRLDLTGEQEYTVSYSVEGAIRRGGKSDFLYWITTGNWETTVEQATAVVVLPNVGALAQRCKIFGKENQGSCQSVGLNQTESRFAATERLLPWSGLAARVEFKPNIIPVANINPPSFIDWVQVYRQPLLILAVISGASFVGAGLLWVKSRRAGKFRKLNQE